MFLIAMSKLGSGRPVVDAVISIFHYCCAFGLEK
jgi:hypothetical protein